jgi:hypothetical protein
MGRVKNKVKSWSVRRFPIACALVAEEPYASPYSLSDTAMVSASELAARANREEQTERAVRKPIEWIGRIGR